MSLIKFIQKLQSKPRYIRIQILWLSVFVSMALIVSFWVISLKGSLPNTAEEKEQDELTQSLNRAKEQLPSLIDALKASIGSFFEDDLIEIEEEEIIQFKKELDKIEPARLPLSKNIND